MIRVALAEPQAMVRRGLSLVLGEEPDLEVVADGETVLSLIHADADVAVIDGTVANGLESARWPCVVLLADGVPPQDAFGLGARGVVHKVSGDMELKEAVRAAAAGGRYLSPGLGALLVDGKPLSRREREVLRLIGLGHTNTEIAAALHLSTRTVEAHRARLSAKLGASTRADLVRAALDRGLR